MASILTNNHYPIGSVCQVVTGWAVQNNPTVAAGNTANLSTYNTLFTPKFPNSLCIYETSIAGQSSSDAGYARFDLYDTIHEVVSQSNTYIGTIGYSHTEWVEIPIRSVFTPSHTEEMRLRLRAHAVTGDFACNWSSSDSRLITITEITQ